MEFEIKTPFLVDSLGECQYQSPLGVTGPQKEDGIIFEDDSRRVLLNNIVTPGNESQFDESFEVAGPREKIYFDPSHTNCAIVSCGGLCPGINNVIRALVLHLTCAYKVNKVLGLRYGLQGLIKTYGHEPTELNRDNVKDINHLGGSILGSSRGGQDIGAMVDYLSELEIGCLFMIGGDGTFRAANEIEKEARKRNIKLSVITVPKTIDNDIMFMEKTFGFDTAFSEASKAIACAHVEASSSPNGIGIVKLMGRHSGYVAAYSALSMREVNLVLIPELPFSMEKVCEIIKHRLQSRGHIVIVVAEGAGQDLMVSGSSDKDQSGNVKLKDIGTFLAQSIVKHFSSISMEVNLKYIDPSYIIRSIPANPSDSVFTGYLGQYAADAAMAGKTGIGVGYWRGIFTHLPLGLASSDRNVIKIESELWRSVLKSTGQPFKLLNA